MKKKEITRSELRKILIREFPTVDDLRAYIIDHFSEVAGELSAQMTRTAIINLLFEKIETERIGKSLDLAPKKDRVDFSGFSTISEIPHKLSLVRGIREMHCLAINSSRADIELRVSLPFKILVILGIRHYGDAKLYRQVIFLDNEERFSSKQGPENYFSVETIGSTKASLGIINGLKMLAGDDSKCITDVIIFDQASHGETGWELVRQAVLDATEDIPYSLAVLPDIALSSIDVRSMMSRLSPLLAENKLLAVAPFSSADLTPNDFELLTKLPPRKANEIIEKSSTWKEFRECQLAQQFLTTACEFRNQNSKDDSLIGNAPLFFALLACREEFQRHQVVQDYYSMTSAERICPRLYESCPRLADDLMDILRNNGISVLMGHRGWLCFYDAQVVSKNEVRSFSAHMLLYRIYWHVRYLNRLLVMNGFCETRRIVDVLSGWLSDIANMTPVMQYSVRFTPQNRSQISHRTEMQVTLVMRSIGVESVKLECSGPAI